MKWTKDFPYSTHIAKVLFDSDQEYNTRVEFQDGHVHEYKSQLGVVAGFQYAKSAGNYFHLNIKDLPGREVKKDA